MHKLAALAITAALGIAAMGYTKPAEARVYVGVGIGLPGVALAAPPVVAYPPAVGVYAPYYYGRPYYPYLTLWPLWIWLPRLRLRLPWLWLCPRPRPRVPALAGRKPGSFPG